MEMESICYQCSKPVKSLEFMQCRGFCNQAAHLKCVGFKRPNMDFVNEHDNLLWFCDKCIDLLKFVKDNPMTITNDVVSAVSDVIHSSLAELKVDLQETKELTKSLTDRVCAKDSCESTRDRPAWPTIKRTRDTAAKETPRSRPNTKLVGGTKSIEKGKVTVATVEKPAPKFWIYLSRIARDVTEDDVSELVKSCLQTEQPVDVRKLVRKDADLQQFAFISFKVGMDMKLKETALDPSVWPKGIFFREFEHQQSARDFWVPAKHPRTGDGTPGLSPAQFATPSQQ